MQDLSFISNMSDEDAYLFKRCVRRLLDTTFLVKDKEEKLYQFVASESNRYDMNQYLAVIGYKVVVEEQMGVAMLQPNDDDKETVGLKRLNLYHFDQRHMKLLLVLWLLFLERMGYEEAVYVTVGEIIDKCRLYDIELTPVEFKKAYATFRRFCLIDYSDDITEEDGGCASLSFFAVLSGYRTVETGDGRICGTGRFRGSGHGRPGRGRK